MDVGRRTVITALVLALGVCAASADEQREPIVLQPTHDPDPPVVRLDGADPGEGLRVGAFTLTDQLGRTVTEKDLDGKPWVASFIFTNCFGFCPNLVGRVRLELYERVDDPDLRFVTFTVDPERDTVERLRKFSETYGADPDRWLFLTGSREELYRLLREGFRVPVVETHGADRRPGFEFVHSLSLMHIGPDGRLIGKYDSRDEAEIVTLRRVLNGEIETPEENRLLPGDGTQEAGDAAQGAGVGRQESGAGPDFGEMNEGERSLPAWAARLPTTNALLNALATALLLAGFAAIRARQVWLHKRMMLLAFGTSIAFLGCYLAYHFALHHYTGQHGRPFEGTGPVRSFYFGLLISHVALAAVVPVLAVITIYRGLSGQWEKHRRIARITFPIWLYVSLTGVMIYGMLYHWPL